MDKPKLLATIILIAITLSPVAFFGYTWYSTNVVLNYTGTETKKVAAFYYQWYGNTTNYTQTAPYNVTDNPTWWHWDMPQRGWYPPTNACSVNTPTWGWYDSADPALIEKHLREAEWAGIDALVSSYWGKNGLEFKHFNTMMEVARVINSNVTLSLYYEIFMDGMEQKKEVDQITFLTEDLGFLYEFMTDPANKDRLWFEQDKPVVWIYVVRAVSADVWAKVLSNLDEKNQNLFIVADRPHQNHAHIAQFQALHQYDVYAPIRDNNYFETFWRVKQNCKEHNQIFVAGVAPGYDDTVVRDGNAPFDRENGEYYKARWNDAISLKPDWISITSWNEWHEGTEIEPSVEHGDLALVQTKQFIQEFKSGKFSELSPYSNEGLYWRLWSVYIYYLIGLVGILAVVALLLKYKVQKSLK
jgi:hypothetical protein